MVLLFHNFLYHILTYEKIINPEDIKHVYGNQWCMKDTPYNKEKWPKLTRFLFCNIFHHSQEYQRTWLAQNQKMCISHQRARAHEPNQQIPSPSLIHITCVSGLFLSFNHNSTINISHEPSQISYLPWPKAMIFTVCLIDLSMYAGNSKLVMFIEILYTSSNKN